MTYDEFWNRSPFLVVCYREAHKRRLEEQNYGFWLQGLYIHDALNVSLSNALGGKKSNQKYLEKPLQIFSPTKEEREFEKRKVKEKVIAQFNTFAKLFNAKQKLKEMEGDVNG